jgi:ABC-type transport system involved in multi-copper enzyme maturation permease subunit
VTRVAYLGTLWILGVTAWQVTVGWGRTPTVGDTSRFGPFLFGIFTLVQLVMLLFFASLSAAGAITQEKDRRTFVLLLLTDLRNYEIVLGKLLGSLLQITLLLAGMLPVLSLILLLGGVAPEQVIQAMLILAATALAAGSLGGLMALWRDKTFQALALTVLLLVLYLCLVRALAVLPALVGWITGSSEPGDVLTIQEGQKFLDPFLALQSVFAADTGLWVAPAYGFTGVMLLLSVLLNAWAILRLRAWNPRGEPIMQRERPEEEEEKDRLKAHAAPGVARPVWANPILWREIRTRAYGRKALLIKVAFFLVLGLVVYFALAPFLATGDRGWFTAAYGLVPVGVLSLLLISAQAVTAITSERDTGALDLLLVTDLTPKEFIYGKLGGICYNVKEYLLTPLILLGVYAFLKLLATPPLPALNFKAAICIGGATLVLLAFAMVLGIHVALRTENSRLAIANTLGTIFFLSVGTLICIYLIVINGRFEYQWTSFIFFLAAGIGGLWWVLSADRPSTALTIASWLCPPAVFYTITNVLVGKPGTEDSADPLVPSLVIAGTFGFTIAAMLIPLISEFDVALGRTTGGGA